MAHTQNDNNGTITTQVANTFAEAQELRKHQKSAPKNNSPRSMCDSTIDSRTNRKVAIVVIDSALRGFKQNAKAIFNNRTNVAVARLLREKNLSGNIFRDSAKLLEYIKQYGARYIDKNGAICHESVALSKSTDKIEYFTALGCEVRYNEDRTTAKALIPATAWSVAQFINMVAWCRREELKQTKGATADARTAQEYLRYCLQDVK